MCHAIGLTCRYVRIARLGSTTAVMMNVEPLISVLVALFGSWPDNYDCPIRGHYSCYLGNSLNEQY